MEVINASMPKTGTKTMHEALRILGYNVCDSQEAVYRHYEDFRKIANGDDHRKEIRHLFGPNSPWQYNAVCDVPMCGMWDVLKDEFPEAKVILIERNEDKWIASCKNHLDVEREQFKELGYWRKYQAVTSLIFNHSSRAVSIYMDWIRPLVLGPEPPNYVGKNMDVFRSRYKQHNLYVKTHCKKEDLLLFQLGDGWEPLCKFLNKPVPNVPFPHMNRMGSIIEELGKDPDYKIMMRKQITSLAIRFGLIILAVYKYRAGDLDNFVNSPLKLLIVFVISLFLIKKI